MTRPRESDYTSHVAYTRDLETYSYRLEALLAKAMDAMQCHIQQTRPILNTEFLIEVIKEHLA